MTDNEPREEPEETECKVPEQKQPEDPEVRVLAEAVGAMRVVLITAENIPKELGKQDYWVEIDKENGVARIYQQPNEGARTFCLQFYRWKFQAI
eukprot:g76743.t1